MTLKKLYSLAAPPTPDPFDSRLVSLAKTRMNTLADYKTLIAPLYVPPDVKDSPEFVHEVYLALEQSFPFTLKKLNKALSSFKQTKRIYKLFYGQETGLPLPEVIEIMGFMWMQERLFRLIG